MSGDEKSSILPQNFSPLGDKVMPNIGPMPPSSDPPKPMDKPKGLGGPVGTKLEKPASDAGGKKKKK
jgi:hypothetical protein